MAAKYKIAEMPDGTFRLESIIGGTDDWLHHKAYKTFEEAETALKRFLAKREWYFDANGEPL